VLRDHALNPTVEGRWSAAVPSPIASIHSHVLPNGTVLSWSRFVDPHDTCCAEGVPPGTGQDAWIWNPADGSMNAVPNAATDPFCSGHAFLPDGRLLVTGGHIDDYVGYDTTQIFDYRTNTWTTNAAWNMNAGRWYPTTVPLANGDVLTISGAATGGDVNATPQVWSANGQAWRNLTNLSGQCFNSTSCLPLYPWLHLASNGQLFVSGPGDSTGYIDTTGAGAWTAVANTTYGYRGDFEATSSMYAPDQILIAGGNPPTTSAEIINLRDPQPRWTPVAPMANPRRRFASIVLPDGTVFVTGGTTSGNNNDEPSVFGAEIWNPVTQTWTSVDHNQVPRSYHQNMVLLPDGRVLVGGGGLGGGFTNHNDYEVYSPPYLFKGDRPTITSVPTSIGIGARFTVATPDAARIAHVNLLRLSSDTHGFNSNQRFVPLSFAAASGQLAVTGPSSNIVAPPGHYLLFILDGNGIPSVGAIVDVAVGVSSGFSDNFSEGNANAWTTYGGTWNVVNGQYTVGANPGAKSMANGTAFSDFTYDVDVSVGPAGNAGVLFRVTAPAVGADAYDGYYAGINAGTGNIEVGRANGGWTPLSTVAAGITANTTVHLRIVVEGQHLQVYLGGTLEVDITDGTYASGGIGLRTWNADARFGNIVVIPASGFNDNFSEGNANAWTTYGGAWNVVNGQYTVGANPGAKSMANGTAFSDFTYDADVSVGPAGNAGVLFRVTAPAVGADAYDGYYAGINAGTGNIEVGRANGGWTPLSTVAAGITANATVHLRVLAQGQHLQVYLGGTLEVDITDGTYASGAIGLRTWNADARFGNVVVIGN
jgi:hypothetical protein